MLQALARLFFCSRFFTRFSRVGLQPRVYVRKTTADAAQFCAFLAAQAEISQPTFVDGTTP